MNRLSSDVVLNDTAQQVTKLGLNINFQNDLTLDSTAGSMTQKSTSSPVNIPVRLTNTALNALNARFLQDRLEKSRSRSQNNNNNMSKSGPSNGISNQHQSLSSHFLDTSMTVAGIF